MANISVCLWMRSLDSTYYGTMMSYVAPSNRATTTFSDVFTLYDYNNLQVIINGEAVKTHMKFNDGYWHHICVIWMGDAGHMRIYVNGTISGSALTAKGTHLEAPGILVIGQRQLGELEQYFVTKTGYVGDISQLSVYNRIIEENVIASLANRSYCTPGNGNVLAWTSVLQGIQGDLRVSANCLDVNECLTPRICKDYEYCVDKTEGYECHACPSAGCPGTPIQHDPCNSSPCLNGGRCVTQLNTYRCICPLGYTGLTCDLLASTCSNVVCFNGGTCHQINSGVYCKCKPPWTGRYCQVLYDARCVEKPCLNGGTCQEHSSTGDYTCNCPSDGRQYGLNCEIITPCERAPSPCISGATCLVLGDNNITCLCPSEFEGESCFYSPPITTPIDYCHNVQCQHGGMCTNLDDGFQCSCPTHYTGLYCENERDKKTLRYDVSVSLDMEYEPSLEQDEIFKEKVKQQVHNIYASSLQESTLRVEIVDIRPGSVEVDMILYHTVYTNTEAPDPKDMEVILYNNLQNNQLGSLPASTNNFKFNYKGGLPTWIIYLLVGIVVITLAVLILVPWYVITKRKQRSHPLKLNNMPMCELNRVINPAFEADSNPATPQMRHLHEDNVYADLDPSPYAVDLCSGGKENDPELNKRFPSKRGRDINKDWASWQRKAVPLPPKPGEVAGVDRARGGRGLPDAMQGHAAAVLQGRAPEGGRGEVRPEERERRLRVHRADERLRGALRRRRRPLPEAVRLREG
ncbi:hypothetical protein LSH36_35g08050 [Paralvinella palmiformis]|uniref:Uncharacterized protein n=1 Tax=Paralvinella palmiformis TaxID=53620 RepID=A0AAD9K8I7_9ANNE|nr:hypothetical protein LSH36_35g08050 [Paralvinella palmiformis]